MRENIIWPFGKLNRMPLFFNIIIIMSEIVTCTANMHLLHFPSASEMLKGFLFVFISSVYDDCFIVQRICLRAKYERLFWILSFSTINYEFCVRDFFKFQFDLLSEIRSMIFYCFIFAHLCLRIFSSLALNLALQLTSNSKNLTQKYHIFSSVTDFFLSFYELLVSDAATAATMQIESISNAYDHDI